MSREQRRMDWQIRLDELFPDGANCIVGEMQIQCPRLMVVGVDGDIPTILIWDETKNTAVQLLNPKEVGTSAVFIWRIGHVTISNYIPSDLAILLRHLRFQADPMQFKLLD